MKLFLFAAFAAAIVLVCCEGILPSALNAQEPSQTVAPTNNRVSPPSCLDCPQPDFPSKGRKAKIPSATVQLDVVISAEGRVNSVQIVSDPGNGFGEKAVEAVKKWKFRPAVRQDGKPVSAKVRIEVTFKRR